MLSFIQELLFSEYKIRAYVDIARESSRSDSDFIAKIVNDKYGKKSMPDIYTLLSRIDLPDLTDDPIIKLEIKYSADLVPIFLHDAWGLFNHTLRENDAQSVEMKRISEQKISKTITVIHLLSRLGMLITENINHKKASGDHERYFDTISKMMDDKHLDLQSLNKLKTHEFSTTLKYIDEWLRSSIFSDKSPTAKLDMKRHEMLARIRSESYAALKQQCIEPMTDPFQYDTLNGKLVTDTNGENTKTLMEAMRSRLDNGMNLTLNIIDNSIIVRTAYERSFLKQSLFKGYMDVIDSQVNRGPEQYIDVVFHRVTVGRVANLACTIQNHIGKDDVEKIASHCKNFNEAKGNYFRDSVHPLKAIFWIFSNQAIGTLITATVTSAGLLTLFDEPEIGSDFYKWWRISSTCMSIVGAALILHNYFYFGPAQNITYEMDWADELINAGDKHDSTRENRIKQEEKEHNKALAKIHEDMDRVISRAAEEEKNGKLKPAKGAETEDDIKNRIKIENEALKKVEEQLEKQRQEMIQAEKQRKEELKKKHESLHSNKGSEWTKKKKNVHEVDIPPPAVPPVNAFIPVHQVPAPAVAAPPPKVAFEPIVVFGYDDPLRNVFINHVKTIMRITQAPIKQQKDNPTLEDLAAMKYDVLQFCEHLTAIHSREGCNQRKFVETLMRAQDIPLINQLRNGLVHNDSVLTDPEKFSLYHDTLELLSVIGELHRHGDIQSNALCAQAIARKDDFPVRINFSETTRPLVDRLIAAQQRMVVNPALIHTITQRQAYLNIICERYLSASSKEETALLSKVLLITIAELGEIYKEIFVHQKLEREFRAMYPNHTVDNRMVDRFINVRRDIVHIQDPKAGDVGVILSTGGSVFKQNVELGMQVG